MGLPEPHPMVRVDFATFRLIGIYTPNRLPKIPYWEALIATLSSQSANRSLAIGDFNTSRAYLDEAGAIDATAHYTDAIEQIGFRDLWRHRYPDRREYSWFSTRNNGFRIDHAFLSQELAACAGTVHYSHEERIAGLSDHSPLILELAVTQSGWLSRKTPQLVAHLVKIPSVFQVETGPVDYNALWKRQREADRTEQLRPDMPPAATAPAQQQQSRTCETRSTYPFRPAHRDASDWIRSG